MTESNQTVTTQTDAPLYSEGAGNILSVSGKLDPAQTYTELWMQDGRVVRLETMLLAQRSNGLPVPLEGRDRAASDSGEIGTDRTVIPLIEESLEVSKRTVTTGKVLLHKRVQEYQETLDEPLAVHTFDVERVVLNLPIESAPAVRVEGDVTIYPLVEEQMVLTKQLILKEEVRVTKRSTERRDTQVVTLRREHLEVERT